MHILDKIANVVWVSSVQKVDIELEYNIRIGIQSCYD